jgi:transglutaminase/protease-like cytokinesis protein 3
MVEQSNGHILIEIRVKSSVSMLFLMVMLSASLQAQLVDNKDHDFEKADRVAALYIDHSLNDLKILAYKLTAPLSTEKEKFRAIYSWVCNNIVYDYNLYLINKRKRDQLGNNSTALSEWNKKFNRQVFNKLLIDGKTICTGYAYLVRELATHAGFACKIIDGYGRTAQSNIGGTGTANHSWNAIKLSGKWYLCDATWSSGAIDTQTNRFIKEYNDSYFLTDPELFIRTHYPIDTDWTLLLDKPSLQKFLDRPIVYNSIYQYKITQLFPESFDIAATKDEAVSFRFNKSNDPAIDKIELKMNGTNAAIDAAHIKEKNGVYSFDHIFTSKGTYIVHFLLDSHYAFTYRVKVK